MENEGNAGGCCSSKGTRFEYEIEIEIDHIRHKLIPLADLLANHDEVIEDLSAEGIKGMGYILHGIADDLEILERRYCEEAQKG